MKEKRSGKNIMRWLDFGRNLEEGTESEENKNDKKKKN